MRKIDFTQYDSFTYKDVGISFTSSNFNEVMDLFKNRKKGIVCGNKLNGVVNILEGVIG